MKKFLLAAVAVLALSGNAHAMYNYCYTARDGVIMYDRPPYTSKDHVNQTGPLPLKKGTIVSIHDSYKNWVYILYETGQQPENRNKEGNDIFWGWIPESDLTKCDRPLS